MHEISVSVSSDGVFYKVSCRCGWSIGSLRYESSAWDLGNTHLERVAGGEER